jgi:osmotically-inducible protein OsmY
MTTTATTTYTDVQLRDRVLRHLGWDSRLDASDIGVVAHEDVVTLTGFVGSYLEKLLAERAAKSVWGVRAVANDIAVRLRLPRTDPEIAADAARALALRTTLPRSIQAVVRDGHVTLTGIAHTLFQKAIAEKAVAHIDGTRGVVNRIQVMPASTPREVAADITRALHREATLSARQITVAVNGTTAVLTGDVMSWHERDAAENAAMHAPGITHVENLIAVVPAFGRHADDEATLLG